MRFDPLHTRVLAEPHDDALRSVWADALLERDDPLGELVSLQIAGSRSPLTPLQDKRLRSLIAKHRVAWLGPLADVVQHREGLVFDRGLLAACQVQVKSLAALDGAIGHPLWGALRTIHFCDRFAWDPRIVPLLAHPVLRELREVICVGMNNVFVALAKNPTPLPITSMWTIDDTTRDPVAKIDDLVELPGLPQLARLGFTFHHEAMWLMQLPVIDRITTLGVTSYARAGTWVGRTRRRTNLETLELRRWWIPIQGPERSHWILRFRRGSGGDWTHLDIEAAGRPTPDMLADDIDSLRPVIDFEAITADADVLAMFDGFAGARIAKPPPPAPVLAPSPRRARKQARASKSRRR